LIRFTKLRWKNFLSTGNVFTEIDLVRSPSTVIIGENGAGKSTILDALCYVLFGKPFRSINKPQLLNSINNKDCLCEIEFTIGNAEYLVRRGMKPNIFEILKNGTELPQPGNSKDFQDILEETILKLNYKSFTQIVVLGNASFTPFMQLSAKDRREIIEDLLDIQIFSSMNVLLKDRIAKNKQDTTDLSYNLNLIDEKITMQKEYLKKLKDDLDNQIESIKSEISEYDVLMENNLKSIDELDAAINFKMNILDSKEKIETKHNKVLDLIQKLQDKHAKAHKRVSFFEKNDNCPTCEQIIDLQIKAEKISKTQELITKTKDAVTSLQKEYDETQEQLTKFIAIQKEITTLQSQLQKLQTENTTYHKQIRVLDAKIQKMKEGEDVVVDDKLDTLTAEKKILQEKKEELSKEKEIYEYAALLLKDGGIKSKIIRQYIPIMNKLINKYLAALDFFVEFQLDEEFNEVIRSRFRDEFSYASFSEGEKMRIDLALLFTWRAIAKIKNSANTNLLILDEVFDASLDTAGCEEFLKLIHEIGAETNVFVISHKGDALIDKFRSLIRFEKIKNFSRIAT
jgi:DNA repair exonuclease SbcCD ATPase subunit